ncbi:hypothetical protein ABEH87_14455 [Erwinia sp. Eh17-17]|uniref:hypothetical protein n=1 Tax=Erwinia sp. Eh17-17 TaxID=3080330 RepID=UPI00320AA55C
MEQDFGSGSIAAAPARSALKNGHADLQRYKRTKKQYGYTHDARAFLHIRDNLYLADARQVLRDYQADRVPVPPYEYDYEAPSAAMLERVRRYAGNTPEYPHP